MPTGSIPTGSIVNLPTSGSAALSNETSSITDTSSEDDTSSPTNEVPRHEIPPYRIPIYEIPGAFRADDYDEVSDSDDQSAVITTPEVNDSLIQQRDTRNPWRTLARFRNPIKDEDLSLFRQFPILSMPAELLLIVAEHLPIESVACLALACKTTYKALGNRSFRMPKANLWNFLLLIEHERQNSFACSRCLKLHRPQKDRFLSLRRHRGIHEMDTVLPHTITPGVVKVIGRKYFEDPRVFQEHLSWVTTAMKKTTRYMKLSVHVIPRMVDGSLLLRTETYMHPFHKGILTERSVMEMAYELRARSLWHGQIPPLCSHEQWGDQIPNLSALLEPVKPTQCTSIRHDQHDDTESAHARTCYSNEPLQTRSHGHLVSPIRGCALIHKQPCRACKRYPGDIYGGNIRGCRKCTTDFAVSACEVQGVGYCVVLSSWKDLGGVAPGEAAKWDTHVRSDQVTRIWGDLNNKCRPQRAVGRIYRAFENVPNGVPGTVKRYRPRPDSKMVRDLTRKVKKQTYLEEENTTDTELDTESEQDGEGRFELW